MSRLRDLQEDFQDYVIASDGRMDAQVVASERAGARERLGIYANAYRLRLLEAMDTDFPGLHALVGDDEFDRLGRAYIDVHPSTHFSLRWYGHRLGEFLRRAVPYSAHPVLAEMADFEWAMSLAFDAGDSAVVTVEHMAALPPEAWAGMRLRPHASLQRLDLRWNVPVFWKAVAAEQEPEAPAEADGPIAWMLWRQALNIYYRSLGADEAWAIDALASGESFSGLCEGLCAWIAPEETPTHAAGMLKRWVQDGMISAIDLPPA